MKRLIVTPTYAGHFNKNERFLTALMRYGQDAQDVRIRYVVSDAEEAATLSAAPAFKAAATRFDIACQPLPELLQQLGATTDQLSRATVTGMGKYSYQSLKKLAGLMANDFDQGLLLDSECLLLRPLALNHLFDDFFAAPTYFVSPQGEPFLETINTASLKVLGWDGSKTPYHGRWVFEYQGWFYERQPFADFQQAVRDQTGQSLLERMLTFPDIFETIAYNWYLWSRRDSLPGYRFPEVADVLREEFGVEEADRILAEFRDEQFGIIEHIMFPLTWRRFRGLQRIVRKYRLSLLRGEYKHARGNRILPALFLKLTPEAKALVCSENAKYVRNLTRAIAYTLIGPIWNKQG